MKVLCIFTYTLLMGVFIEGARLMMTGGWSDVKDLDSPELQKYAKLATDKLVADINSAHHLKLMNITKAQKQVVSGINYKIHMAIGPSECLKSGNFTEEEIDACPLQPCERPLQCSAKVWVQVWLKEDPIKISETMCLPGESFC